MAESIKKGTGGAVNDGFYKPHFGTSASIVKDMQIPGPEIVGLNVVPGDPSYQSSYRSELAGMAASTTIVEMLCQVHIITEGSIDHCTGWRESNGEQWNNYGIAEPSAPDFDLINSIRRRVKQLPITIHWEHVKGHQRQGHHSQPLPPGQAQRESRWLCQAALPKLPHCGECQTTNLGVSPSPSISKGKKLSKFDPKHLYDEIVGAELNKYWQKKHFIPAQLIDNIDWAQPKESPIQPS